MSGKVKIVIAVIVLLSAFLLTLRGVYSSMEIPKQRLDEAWRQVEATTMRRFDLVAALVRELENYSPQKADDLTRLSGIISTMEDAVTNEEKLKALHAIDAVLPRLVPAPELAPEIKTKQNIITIQEGLEGVKSRLSAEKIQYNHCVQEYNEVLMKNPNCYIAPIMGFKPAGFIENPRRGGAQ